MAGHQRSAAPRRGRLSASKKIVPDLVVTDGKRPTPKISKSRLTLIPFGDSLAHRLPRRPRFNPTSSAHRIRLLNGVGRILGGQWILRLILERITGFVQSSSDCGRKFVVTNPLGCQSP